MKKRPVRCIVFILLCFCSTNESHVEKAMENGVEIVLNHVEPYVLKDEKSAFSLDRLFSIDTERDEVAEMGLGDIASFDADSQGNI